MGFLPTDLILVTNVNRMPKREMSFSMSSYIDGETILCTYASRTYTCFNASFHSSIVFRRATTMMRIAKVDVSEARALETPNTSSKPDKSNRELVYIKLVQIDGVL